MHARPMTAEHLGAWLGLTRAPALPSATLRLLLSAFGGPQALLAQSPHVLAETAGSSVAQAIAAAARADVTAQLEHTRAWCAEPGHSLLALDDPAYPPALLTMHDPPPLLYVSGELECLHAPGVAIVGSRHATPQGLDDAARFARELAASGLVIVSGLALGIDGAAHRGALDAHGATVAVVGTGADLVYPTQHRALAQDIAARGALVSEWPLGTPAKPAHFPQRNRLIAGMTKGVLVIEAALRSGSLITARLANEMGRDVFALPGSIHAPLSKGCHQLIKDGAMLTETPDDVLEALAMGIAPTPMPSAPRKAGAARGAPGAATDLRKRVSPAPALPPRKPVRAAKRVGPGPLPLFDARACEPAPAEPPTLSAPAGRLLEALGHAPAALEILAARTEMGSAELQGALLELELRGYLTALPGGRYVRHSRG